MWREEKIESKSVLLNSELMKGSGTQIFQLFFLIDNKDCNVEVIEMEELDLTEVKRHIDRGESVFITQRYKEKPKQKFVENRELKTDPWYFTHI